MKSKIAPNTQTIYAYAKYTRTKLRIFFLSSSSSSSSIFRIFNLIRIYECTRLFASNNSNSYLGFFAPSFKSAVDYSVSTLFRSFLLFLSLSFFRSLSVYQLIYCFSHLFALIFFFHFTFYFSLIAHSFHSVRYNFQTEQIISSVWRDKKKYETKILWNDYIIKSFSLMEVRTK